MQTGSEGPSPLYIQTAVPFGRVSKDKQTSHRRYPYVGKAAQVNALLANHGKRVQYIDHPSKHPHTTSDSHVTVLDPHGDEYHDVWRKLHELAHHLTAPIVDKLYGTGKRNGKLGHDRTMREALRNVHHTHLAAHKQRELSKQIGADISEDQFNHELNTVMHESVHRAITGEHSHPEKDGFTPHSHRAPLETALQVVREHARNLGLQGQHDLLKSERNEPVADKEYELGEAMPLIAAALKKKVDEYTATMRDLRIRELSKAETCPLCGQNDKAGSCACLSQLRKDEGMDAGGGDLALSECTGEPLCKCGSCSKLDRYAKGELSADEKKGLVCTKPDPKAKLPGDKKSKDASDNGSGGDVKKGKKLSKAVLPGELAHQSVSEGTAPPPPPPAPVGKSTKEEDADWEADKVQAQLDSKKPQKSPKQPTSGSVYRKDEKPKLPKLGAPKMPGAGPSKLPKPTAPAAAAKPAMPGAAGAGAPAPAAPMGKGELSENPEAPKGSIPVKKADAPSASVPRKLGEGKIDAVRASTSNIMDQMLAAPKPAPKIPGRKISTRDQKNDLAARPHAAASAGKLMDNMLAPSPLAPQTALPTGTTLPATAPSLHLAGVGQPTAKPAQGVQTMTERVASNMPSGTTGLKSGSRIPGRERRTAAPAPALAGHLNALPTVTKKNETK